MDNLHATKFEKLAQFIDNFPPQDKKILSDCMKCLKNYSIQHDKKGSTNTLETYKKQNTEKLSQVKS